MPDDIVYTNGFIKSVFIKNSFKSLVKIICKIYMHYRSKVWGQNHFLL